MKHPLSIELSITGLNMGNMHRVAQFHHNLARQNQTVKRRLVFSMYSANSARPSYWFRADVINNITGEVEDTYRKILGNNFDLIDLAIAIKDIQESFNHPVGAATLAIIGMDAQERLVHLGFEAVSEDVKHGL